MCWSTILLKPHLLHNPIVAGIWYNKIAHLILVTPLKFLSNKYGPMTLLAVTPELSSFVVCGLTSQTCNKDTV